jgi:prevent-host-death family protein
MNQVIGMVEAKSKLAELVGQVKYGGKRYVLERRGRPMAMLVSVEEYEQLQARVSTDVKARISPLPPDLQRRQAALVARAHELEQRLGDPIAGLADLFSALPRADDDFWVEIQETG